MSPPAPVNLCAKDSPYSICSDARGPMMNLRAVLPPFDGSQRTACGMVRDLLLLRPSRRTALVLGPSPILPSMELRRPARIDHESSVMRCVPSRRCAISILEWVWRSLGTATGEEGLPSHYSCLKGNEHEISTNFPLFISGRAGTALPLLQDGDADGEGTESAKETDRLPGAGYCPRLVSTPN